MEIAGIYNQFHTVLFKFIRSHVRSKEDAEDILHNVFIKISTKLHSLSEEDKLQSWVFSITRNAIIDYYRAKDNKANIALNESLPQEEEAGVSSGLDKCLVGFIEELPEDYKTIIIDSEIKGIKQKELAEKYDMAYPTVRSKVQRGRERLKQMLVNCCKIELDTRGNIMDAEKRNNCNDPCESCE